MIKRYLRNKDNVPFGLVVYENGKFGWSLCCEKDHFNKKRAEQIAVNRMMSDKSFAIMSKKPVLFYKYEIEVKRGNNIVRYPSKIDAVLDKIMYLKTKLSI